MKVAGVAVFGTAVGRGVDDHFIYIDDKEYSGKLRGTLAECLETGKVSYYYDQIKNDYVTIVPKEFL